MEFMVPEEIFPYSFTKMKDFVENALVHYSKNDDFVKKCRAFITDHYDNDIYDISDFYEDMTVDEWFASKPDITPFEIVSIAITLGFAININKHYNNKVKSYNVTSNSMCNDCDDEIRYCYCPKDENIVIHPSIFNT